MRSVREGDIHDLTPFVRKIAAQYVGDRALHLFVIGSTAAIITIEFEPGLVHETITGTPVFGLRSSDRR